MHQLRLDYQLEAPKEHSMKKTTELGELIDDYTDEVITICGMLLEGELNANTYREELHTLIEKFKKDTNKLLNHRKDSV